MVSARIAVIGGDDGVAAARGDGERRDLPGVEVGCRGCQLVRAGREFILLGTVDAHGGVAVLGGGAHGAGLERVGESVEFEGVDHFDGTVLGPGAGPLHVRGQ